MARTDAPPATDPRMWRRLLAAVHPDRAGGEDGGLFTWATALREHVEGGGRLCFGCALNAGPGRSYATGADRTEYDAPARVPFSAPVSHVELITRALNLARAHGGPRGAILERLGSYQQATSGRAQLAEQRGATYKQLRYLVALADVPARDVYDAGEAVPLSQAMAGFLIAELLEGRNYARSFTG